MDNYTIISRTDYDEPRAGYSLFTDNYVETIGEQVVEHEGKTLEQYLYNIVGYTPANGLPFAALKANIIDLRGREVSFL